jgi:iron complex outermembrane receptor protein
MRNVCVALALSFLASAGMLPSSVAAVDAESETKELAAIKVTAVAPEQGADLPEALVPYAVQSATSEQFERVQALDATDYLNRRSTGITISSTQGNPLQPDLQFRGFTASPLLGGSEGISVYVDGVRVNEVFGDTVNWDLIPEEAMAKISLLAGANPVFGLNTLGGAILIQTKNGFSDPGSHSEIYAGSFGRSETTVESGGNNGRWGYYALANHFEEDGWRDLSNSNASSFLSTLSRRSEAADFDLHLAHAETKLTGNGAQAAEVLAVAPNSVLTAPDRTQNLYSAVSAQGTYKFSAQTLLTATSFVRQVNTRSYNGDVTSFLECENDEADLCDSSGALVRDQTGAPVPSRYNAVDNIGLRKQRSYGGSLQLVSKRPLWAMSNQFVVGLDYDHGRVNYGSVLEASYLVPYSGDPQYSFFTAADSGILVPEDALAVHIADSSAGLYATDTLSLTEKFAVTLSGRYNRTHIAIADSSGNNPDLDGSHAFHRFNPAGGATYRFSPALNFYGSYSESTRAPTPVELTCASANAPCRLPNSFAADPELNEVVAEHIEMGLRGTSESWWNGTLHWQAGLFRTTNQKDILFQATGGAQSNEGFFANVGDTRRQGLETSFNGKAFEDRLDWYASFAYLDATFRTAFVERSANNPYADATGLIQVQQGDRIPGIPSQAFKFGADYRAIGELIVGGDIVYNSSRYLRGDESNRINPVPSYAVTNLRAKYRINEHVSLFTRVDNIFDRRFHTFGLIGNASDIYPAVTNSRFLSPGAPRGAWIGIDVSL